MGGIIFTVVCFALLLVLALRLVRRKKLAFKYAVAWTTFTSVALVFGLVPNLLTNISQALGFVQPSNLFFVVAIFTLAALTLQLSVGVSRLDQRVEAIAREIALKGDSKRHEHDS
jgi:hypothetical protein